MTFKEFKNLKVHDIIYSWDTEIEEVIETQNYFNKLF